MVQNETQDPVTLIPPAFPKAGEVAQGLGERLLARGPDGQAVLSLPLPILPGRGYAPDLHLSYGSHGGNGAWGNGWSLPLLTVARRTQHGVPGYRDDDIFTGPGGDVLIPIGDEVRNHVVQFDTLPLNQPYRVRRYQPRIEGAFDRIERWQGEQDSHEFWFIRGADGQHHLLGYSASARIADPQQPQHIAQWLLEESVSPLGEHCRYRYVGGDKDDAQCYLQRVDYANVSAAADPYLLTDDPDETHWLYSLCFDYGERGDAPLPPPIWQPTGGRRERADSFSRFQFGFELRTRYLCRQVVLFGRDPKNPMRTPEPTHRLWLTYDEHARGSLLRSAQRHAWESDGKIQALPPLSLDYTSNGWSVAPFAYRQLPDWPEMNRGEYQLVDLFGEGLPGMLYQMDGLWGYQAPQRGAQNDSEVGYGPWTPLPLAPSGSTNSPNYLLMDITGDSRLDWVVAFPDMAGFFSLEQGVDSVRWQQFVPFSAFPAEFFHEQKQLVDLIGNGLVDIALIGPHSVRLYANDGSGFLPAQEVVHEGTSLPLPNYDDRKLVAWSDVLGSGQPHLVQVCADGLTCWPNLGHGRFAAPRVLSLHQLDDDVNFSPDRVFLVDLCGTGAADLLYARADGLYIYLNQSGNGFDDPQCLPWPADFHWDSLQQISFADLSGTGGASLILSRRHMAPQHWCYDFIQQRGGLLETINNNQGLLTEIGYYSSAQSWLDEKHQHPTHVCHMPLNLPVVDSVWTYDEITGLSNLLEQTYYGGVYDGQEREWRGFRRVDSVMGSEPADGSGQDLHEEQLERRWYHTGRPDDELRRDDYFNEDDAAFSLGATRLTRWQQQDETITDALPAAVNLALHRALAGSLLHQECYGIKLESEDGVLPVWVPYNVSDYRWQVRLCREGQDSVVLPSQLESVTWNYERQLSDPACQQQVTLVRDEFGAVIREVSVYYPRRRGEIPEAEHGLTPEQWQSTQDDAQRWLWFDETLNHWHHLHTPTQWRLAQPAEQTRYALSYRDDAVDIQRGLNYERLSEDDGLLAPQRARQLTGWQRWKYASETPDRQGLLKTTETALLDAQRLALYREVLTEDALAETLLALGYVTRTLADGQQIQALPSNVCHYLDAECFYRLEAIDSANGAALASYEYEQVTMLPCAVTDALGNRAEVGYDHRFWQPSRAVDINGNVQETLFDALGRPVAMSWYGTQEGKPHGFSPLTDFSLNWPTPLEAIAQPQDALQHAAVRICYDPLSWMGNVNGELHRAAQGDDSLFMQWQQTLIAAHCLDVLGNLCARGHAWARGEIEIGVLPDALKARLRKVTGRPAHRVEIVADTVAQEAQTPRMEIVYFDGVGRIHQQKRSAPPGNAYLSQGQYLVTDENGVLQQAFSQTRWLTATAQTRSPLFDAPAYTVAPYFVDSPEAIDDRMLIMALPTTVQYSDALGRETLRYNELSEYQYQSITPWFSVTADKNDLLWLHLEEEEENEGTRSLAAISSNGSTIAMHSERVDVYDRANLQEMQYYHFGNGVRSYSPWSGRFLSMDDADFSPFDDGGINPYSFANCDPINFSDPTGHISAYAITTIGFGLLALAVGVLTFGIGTAMVLGAGMSIGAGAMLFGGAMGVISGGTGIAAGALHDSHPDASQVLSNVSIVAGMFSLVSGLSGLKSLGAVGSAARHANHARRLNYGRRLGPRPTGGGPRAPRWATGTSYNAAEQNVTMLTREGRLLSTARSSRFANATAPSVGRGGRPLLTPGNYFQNTGSAFTTQGELLMQIGRELGHHAPVKFFMVGGGIGAGLLLGNAAYWHEYWKSVRTDTKKTM